MKLSLVLALFLALFSISTSFAESPDSRLSPIKTVDFSPRIGFRVNEQPFFPILLYDAPTDDATLAQLREFGFNVLTCRPEACDALLAQGFYSAIHIGRHKTIENPGGVLLTMGTDSPALYYKKNLLEQVAEANAKVTAVVPNRPLVNAIGYWEDEPAGVVAGKLPSKEKYEDLVAALDVSAPYLYPVPYQPVASVGDAVARARLATDGKKPLLPILQIFAWEPQARYPTPAELRSMTYLALIEGAHGIGFYSYGHVTGQPKTTIAAAQPELWNSVKALNREIAEIGPILITSDAADVVSLDKPATGIKFRAIRHHSGFLAVVINSTSTKQDVKLNLQSVDAQASLKLDRGKQIAVQQGAARISLDPFGVEVLRWKP